MYDCNIILEKFKILEIFKFNDLLSNVVEIRAN